jgi:type III secretion protein V
LREALKVAERNKRTAALGGYVPHAISYLMLPIVTPIAMEFADNLAVLFEGPDGDIAPALAQRLVSMRDRIKEDMGVNVPGLRIRKNDADLPPGTYILMLDEVPVVFGNLALDKMLTLVPTTKLSELGIRFEDAVNPADGTPASWVALADAARLPDAPWDAMECAVRHLDSLIRKNLFMFAGMQEVIDKLEQTWSTAGRQIASDQALAERFTRMTQALLDEFVPMTPLEPLCDAYLAASGKGMDELLGAARALPELRPKLPGNETGATLFELDPDVERKIEDGLMPLGDEFVLTLTPEYTQEVLTAVRNIVSPPSEGPPREAIVVREPKVRRYVRKLVELEFPQLFTLAVSELTHEAMQVKRIAIALD